MSAHLIRNIGNTALLVSSLILSGPMADAQRGDTAAKPIEVLPRPERLLLWSPQEKPVGFRNMEKISPVHEVERGPSVFPLSYASRELMVSYSRNGQRLDTTTFMEENDVAGLIVIKNGLILTERYALGFDEKSLWTSFSVAKSITSTLLGAAIADGHIKSVDDPVTRYLPTLKGSAYDHVSIRQVLNMTSGVKWNEDYSDPDSDVNKCHRATDRSLGSPLLTYLAKLPQEAPPGTKFVYKTAETDLAGEIVIAATGKPLGEYLSEKIWAKFGMERNAYWMIRDEKELGGCCLSMTLRDYARFGLFFLNGGVINGRQILPASWTEDALKATNVSRDAIARNGGHGGYGYQWWIESDGPQTYAARGIFGQSIHFNPAENLIIVTLSAWPKPLDPSRRSATLDFQAAVTQASHTSNVQAGSSHN
jgi:CubicO group peptidase (beta-lactamase class C family)